MVGSILVYSFSPRRRRVQHRTVAARPVPLHHVHRRVRGVGRGGDVAGGTVRRQAAARDGDRVDAGVRVARRHSGDGGVPRDRRRSCASTPRACRGCRCRHAAWRYTLLTGLIPGALILVLMPFVPESRVWKERKLSGTLKRPSFGELFSPELRKTTIVTTLLSACGYAAAFGALQLTPLQMTPGLPAIEPVKKEHGPAVKAAQGKLTAADEKLSKAESEADKKAAAGAKVAAEKKSRGAEADHRRREREARRHPAVAGTRRADRAHPVRDPAGVRRQPRADPHLPVARAWCCSRSRTSCCIRATTRCSRWRSSSAGW